MNCVTEEATRRAREDRRPGWPIRLAENAEQTKQVREEQPA